MKKTKIIRKTVRETITTNILCNKCGGTCMVREEKSLPEDHPHRRIFYGLLEKELWGGYESTHLDDLTAYRFSLCEGCLRKMFDSFKIPVEVKPDYVPDFISEAKQPKALAKHNKEIEKMNREYLRKQKKKNGE